MDNTYLPLPTADDFKAMHASMVAAGTANFLKAQALKAQVAAATTIAEVEAVVW